MITPFAIFLGASLAALIISIANAVIYANKLRANNIDNNVCATLIVINLVSLFLEVGCYIAVANIDANNEIYWMIVLKLYVVALAAYIIAFTVYILLRAKILPSTRPSIVGVSAISAGILIILTAVIFFTDVFVFNDGFFAYTYGPGIDMLYVPMAASLCGFAGAVCIWKWRLLRRDKALLFVALFAIVGSVSGAIQFFQRGLLVTTLAQTIIVLVMANTIENPDRKLLAQRDREKRELKRLNQTKDDFLSLASHQLRTPLTSIVGYASMLSDGDFDGSPDEQKKAADAIVASGKQMSDTIFDLLNVSRIQSGKFIISKEQINLVNLIQKEIAEVKPHAVEKGIKIKFNKPAGKTMISADAEKIQHVVMNFLDNAINYAKSTGGVIEATLVGDEDNIEFRVRDNGIGVPAHERKMLFDKFFRAGNARNLRPNGTGIGLYLAKEIISAHGGTIIFESTEGEGSVFGFKIPK
ncbi:HAMP domain-containing histidine kinase [Candidatus Saccharibacteria bacterium]|nr:HAMP domain-containing histidine kinase [Candidatus Saccharibacteria bacterium]MCL1963221.1 HAMP domain-containing histidine kinase [Candidatus Saccharibacteria bacterium]